MGKKLILGKVNIGDFCVLFVLFWILKIKIDIGYWYKKKAVNYILLLEVSLLHLNDSKALHAYSKTQKKFRHLSPSRSLLLSGM